MGTQAGEDRARDAVTLLIFTFRDAQPEAELMNEVEREELLAQIRAEHDEFAERITNIVHGTTKEVVARINDLYGINEDLRKEFFDLLTRVSALEIGVDPALLRERLEKAKADQAAKAARAKLSVVKSDPDPKSSA